MNILVFILVMTAVIIVIALALLFFGGTDIHFHHRPKPGKIRVACVGDSITNGATVINCFRNSYPSKLQKLLGNKYHVENYGLNDRTAQSSGNKPYRWEKEYRRSIAFEPDIVIILLGSNDTKPVNWISREHFASEYRALLNSYLQNRKDVRIILCTPPWAIAPEKPIQKITNDINAARLPDVAEVVREIGAQFQIPVVELLQLFTGHRELLSFDALHPNARGEEQIARQICSLLVRPAWAITWW